MAQVHREAWILLAVTLSEDDALSLPTLVDRLAEAARLCPDETGPDFYRPGDTATVARDCEALAVCSLIVTSGSRCAPAYAITPDGLRSAMIIGGEASAEALRCLGG